ncbi:hypothetical protein CYMTET_33830, partial [Cymbomonas tetramitiformis]
GVSPARLVATAKRNFESSGGRVLERSDLVGITVHPDCASLQLRGPEGEDRSLKAKLVLDCMGNASPIVRQLRWGRQPDGVCLVVGTCARGFPDNSTGDVIYTNTDISDYRQTFWEAFPAGSGPTDRTTYMFTYLDAHPDRPSLTRLLDEYWDAMPQYQNVKLEDLEVLRCLFGWFPTYKESPLAPGFDRVMQVPPVQTPRARHCVPSAKSGVATRLQRAASAGDLTAIVAVPGTAAGAPGDLTAIVAAPATAAGAPEISPPLWQRQERLLERQEISPPLWQCQERLLERREIS